MEKIGQLICTGLINFENLWLPNWLSISFVFADKIYMQLDVTLSLVHTRHKLMSVTFAIYAWDTKFIYRFCVND